MDNKHSVTKELDVTIEIEDFFDELETSEKKEFLTEQFEDLDVKDQIEVAKDALGFLGDSDLADVLNDKFFYLDEGNQDRLLETIIDQFTTSQVQRLRDYLQKD